MAKKKVMLVFGTRPEAIKMAPVVGALKAASDEFEVTVTVTGQHRQMLDSVLDVFGIRPDYDLNIMKPGQDLYDVTSRVLEGMRDVLKESRPDIVLVHGDTSTSTAAALAAFYARVKVGHVEAGLRTGDIYSPWPEEMNRRLTGRLANLHFSPTDRAKDNLLAENVDEDDIFVTGNTVIDALIQVKRDIEQSDSLRDELARRIKSLGFVYALYMARRKGLKVLRFPVDFPERVHGESKWNTGLASKWKFIKRTLDFSVKLKRAL